MHVGQRTAIADATLAAGATVLLLYSTASDRAWWALALGIGLVIVGAALLWGTPRPRLAARLVASLAGLLLVAGLGSLAAGWGAWVAVAAGVALLLGVLRATARPIRARSS